jgi:hypothetical protein
MDPITIAGAAVAALAPFLPALTSAGGDLAQRAATAVAEHGGEVAFDVAEKVWKKITSRFGQDAEVKSLSGVVAAAPENPAYQELLTKALAERLKNAPDLARDLEDALGGPQAVQRIALGNKGVVEKVRLEMAGTGTQTIEMKDEGRVTETLLRMGYPPQVDGSGH